MVIESERVTIDAPEVIKDLLVLPYLWVLGQLGTHETVLDVGGGEVRAGYRLLDAKDIDVDEKLGNDFTGSITALPFKDGEFDTVTCFETIEHISTPLQGLSELVRVAKNRVFLGSVNSAGPSWLRGGIAIWKGADNKFHLNEMDNEQFKNVLKGLNVKFYSTMQSVYPQDEFVIVEGNHKDAIVNYAVITK